MFQVNEVVNHNNRPWIIFEIISPEAASQHQIFWIVNDDDEIIMSQLMNKNDEYSYELKSNYSITSGNAGHILVIIDQKVRGKIGKKGQVVDSLILSKDFNN